MHWLSTTCMLRKSSSAAHTETAFYSSFQRRHGPIIMRFLAFQAICKHVPMPSHVHSLMPDGTRARLVQ